MRNKILETIKKGIKKVCHTGLEPRTSRQGPRQVLFCYAHVRALPLTGP